MKYRDRTTGYIYTLSELQAKFSNTSFPVKWSADTYDYANVDSVVETPPPAESHMRYRVEFDGVKRINNVWTETWKEVPKYDNPEQQAEWEAICLATQWDAIRTHRNLLLTETDYTQMPDTPIHPDSKAAFVTYRQALRNITNQSDPYAIVWPELPQYITVN